VRSLRGRHNLQNALAAVTALRALQDRLDAQGRVKPLVVWKPAALQAALANFPGLPHRMEEIGRVGKVLFINDSKATNADSTDKALASWERDIFWILGGKSKEGGITSLESYFPRIAKAYLIGAATEEFAATLQGKVDFERCGTLDVALGAAARDSAQSAGKEPVVLLSPACASYDQYKNFEVRGDHFRKLVSQLPGIDLRPSSP
jgi:UDP-N-acetylmuramoylalanine--D-glutamate ligase